MSRRLALPLLLLLVACESATAPSDALTTEEATAAFSAIQQVGYWTMQSALRDGGAMLRSPSLPTVMQTDTLALSRTCPAGGRSNAVVYVAQDSTNATIDVRQRFAQCAVTSDSGRTWTFDADPGIRTRLAVSISGGSFDVTGSMAGAFSFTSDVKSGRCTVDVDLVMVTTDSIPHIEARGTFCGRDITQTFDPGT